MVHLGNYFPLSTTLYMSTNVIALATTFNPRGPSDAKRLGPPAAPSRSPAVELFPRASDDLGAQGGICPSRAIRRMRFL